MRKCGRCGVDLSMPLAYCQNCGHPIDPSEGFSTGLTGPTSSEITPRPAEPDPSSDHDESKKVQHLLEQIAAQSHFEERYVLSGEIAVGGMGRVFRAFDRIMRRDVGIKMMRERYDSSSESALRGQFLKEARVGGRLLHPNILAVFDLGVNRAGHIYFTMRLVDGASLKDCLDSVDKGVVTKLISYPLRRIIEAMVGACQGVDYAHQQGVLHLDLKPHNILVSGFNEVFVIDWGLARVDETDDTEDLADIYRHRSDSEDTASNTLLVGTKNIGTPAYMATEQVEAAVSTFNPTTDVYGLGGILHFILYGSAPNRGQTIREMYQASSDRKNRGKARPGILPRGQRVKKEALIAFESLEVICLKALEPQQQDRHDSVEAMIVELGEWLASTPDPPLGF